MKSKNDGVGDNNRPDAANGKNSTRTAASHPLHRKCESGECRKPRREHTNLVAPLATGIMYHRQRTERQRRRCGPSSSTTTATYNYIQPGKSTLNTHTRHHLDAPRAAERAQTATQGPFLFYTINNNDNNNNNNNDKNRRTSQKPTLTPPPSSTRTLLPPVPWTERERRRWGPSSSWAGTPPTGPPPAPGTPNPA